MARAATNDELTLFRTAGQWSKVYAAIFQPATIYTARINQTFSTLDGVLELIYDTPSGTLANVRADMTVLVGSSAGAHDVGIVRLRSIDASKVYIGETSDVSFADNQYLTIIDDFGLWARQVKISAGVPYMDGGTAYSNQHANFDPVPIMGTHRILKLTGASVSTQFNAASSYCLGSSISSYSWSAATASAASGMTTATPTITFNTVGWHLVYLTVTAANGKSFIGVRYVYVWNESNLPAAAGIDECRCDAEAGGWSFNLTLFEDADLTTIRDRALVIVFAEDFYGDTQQSIGPVAGSENILVTGWIAKETIDWNPEVGQVRFGAYGAQHWMQNIPAWPDGVEFITGTPAAWTEIQNLTVNKGLHHFIHWRTTATRIMDVFLTDDTKYTKEVSSLAQNLWEQLREMAFLQIFARPGVNALGQLYIEVHPQLVPSGSRTWPTVMTITSQDWQEKIEFERVTIPPVATVNLSGVAVNSSGVGTSYFSLSPGHAHPHYGKPEIMDLLLLDSQSQSNTLCGLYWGWRNNPYPEIPIIFQANNRLVDCFPRQKCAITIAAADTVRGISYSGNLIPTAVAWVQDPETGYLHTEVSFEAETFPGLAVNGDVPGSTTDISIPPPPPLPPLPDFPIIIPGVPPDSTDSPVSVLFHDRNAGLILAENFDATPTYRTINSGLTAGQAASIDWIGLCPNGSVYVGKVAGSGAGDGTEFLARAPSLGATFVIQTFPAGAYAFRTIHEIALNPMKPEEVCVWVDYGVQWFEEQGRFWVGANNVWTGGLVQNNFGSGGNGPDCLSYGLGYWLVTRFNEYKRINPACTAVVASGTPTVKPKHLRASTTGRTFHEKNGADTFIKGEDNLATTSEVSSGQGIQLTAAAGTGVPVVCACDPTGTYLMARGLGASKAKSSDAGSTWSAIPSLPPGNWWYGYAGANGSTPRFIAANAVVRFTPDFGTTWVNKENASLTGIAPFPDIDIIKVIGLMS